MSYNKILIDADICLFQAALAAEREICWDPEGDREIWSIDTDLRDAKKSVINKIRSYQKETGIREFVPVVTSDTNFRKTMVYEDYKGNRKDVRKPLGYRELKNWFMGHFDVQMREGLEADDVITWYATAFPEEYVIVSMDKDFMQVPGRFYRVSPKGAQHSQMHDISKEDARRFLLKQSIMGDATDGYAGCPGFGDKTAEKWLDKYGWNWGSVVKAYESKDLTEEYALQMARCARLLTVDDYVDGEIKLWNPQNF